MNEEELTALEKTAANDLEDYYGGWYAEQIGKLCAEVRRLQAENDALGNVFNAAGHHLVTGSEVDWWALKRAIDEAVEKCGAKD